MNQPATESARALRVLVAEDNVLIGEFIRQILVDLGCTVAGPFETLDEALDAIRVDRVDGAILDFELGDANCLPAVSALAERGIPYIVASGQNGAVGFPASLAQSPFLCKPFDVPEFESLVLRTFPFRQGI